MNTVLLEAERAHHKTRGTQSQTSANTQAKRWLGKHPLC